MPKPAPSQLRDSLKLTTILTAFTAALTTALAGAFVAYIFGGHQREIDRHQRDLDRTRFEWEIFRWFVEGDDDVKKNAITLLEFVAERFEDRDFATIVLQIPANDPSPSVRQAAQETILQLDTRNPDSGLRSAAKRDLDELRLRERLAAADGFFGTRQFRKAADAYESAAQFVPQRVPVDLEELRLAREAHVLKPESASRSYRRFFAPLRRGSTPTVGDATQ